MEPQSENANKANAVKAARIWAGFESANAAAKALKMDQSSYNKLEKNGRFPGGKMLKRLAHGFGCKADHLLGMEDLPAREPILAAS